MAPFASGEVPLLALLLLRRPPGGSGVLHFELRLALLTPDLDPDMLIIDVRCSVSCLDIDLLTVAFWVCRVPCGSQVVQPFRLRFCGRGESLAGRTFARSDLCALV